MNKLQQYNKSIGAVVISEVVIILASVIPEIAEIQAHLQTVAVGLAVWLVPNKLG